MTAKTNSKKIRKAPVRLTDAISLEPFYNEIDFSTNAGLASRIGENNDIYQSEIHRSYYTYSITVDLDRVGVDENYDIELSKEERIKRLNALLYAVKVLNRDIKGKRENLSPLFIIGGIYKSGNPFFYNQIRLSFEDGVSINEETINQMLDITMFSGEKVKDTTYLGFIPSYFKNIDKINLDSSRKLTIEEFFKALGSSVADYYQSTPAVNSNAPKLF
jgi:CRISPR-associated protein Cst2